MEEFENTVEKFATIKYDFNENVIHTTLIKYMTEKNLIVTNSAVLIYNALYTVSS